MSHESPREPGLGPNPAPHGAKLGAPNPGRWLLPATGRVPRGAGTGKDDARKMLLLS